MERESLDAAGRGAYHSEQGSEIAFIFCERFLSSLGVAAGTMRPHPLSAPLARPGGKGAGRFSGASLSTDAREKKGQAESLA